MPLLSYSPETLAGALTPAVLFTLSLRWRHTSRGRMIRDLIACVLCLALRPFRQPQLPLALAIVHTVWTYLYFSHEAPNLPSHSTFMRNLVFVNKSEPEVGTINQFSNQLIKAPILTNSNQLNLVFS